MTFRPAVLFSALLFGCISLPAAAQGDAGERPAAASVMVGPDPSGNWTVSYDFENPQTVLAFSHSSSGYRDATWSVVGGDAQFGRVNGIDVIVFDKPSRNIDFSIIPLTGQLQDDETPFVTFSDGGIAIYDAQFELVPFNALSAVEQLEEGIGAAASSALPLDITVSSDQPFLNKGKRTRGSLTQRVNGTTGNYIYTGPATAKSFQGFSLVLDPGLPHWIASEIGTDIEGFLRSLEDLWGYELAEPFTVMIAYKGPQGQGLSLHGNALDGQLLLELGGQGFTEPNNEALAYLHWYTIREIVQLFQTGRGVVLGGPEAAWIHDGAANSIAYQLIASDMQSSDQFLSSVYSNVFEDCVKTLEGGTLESARARGTVTGPYACGDLIALSTDSYLRRRDLFGFWSALSDWASRSPSKVIDKKVYFTTLQLLGATPAQREKIRTIVEDKLDEPRKALTELLESAGLNPQFSGGRLVSLDWPDYDAPQ